ncbi:DUF1580 domain-containing protein [Lacipirellula parvula]|uniref:Uncharacterized protein n=1 Tax=Lacipirellula parvula TaxID=2650471 RepID=A0A5K7XGH9_9BACT|nr:DUF1580 domain-containing protein [Lacipirellula parvula]BBO35558.1 hypothetical protein PLANPX_5170 [Lacipirellula parvula]
MSDYLNETRVSLSELATREGVNVSTVWRWTLRGVRGVTLESFAVGGRRFTTLQAFERFVEKSTAASPSLASAAPRPSTHSSQREAAIQAAENELDNAGV